MLPGFSLAARISSPRLPVGTRGMACHHVGRGGDQRDRGQILLVVERQVRQQARIDRVGVEHDQPGIAVGRRLRHRARCRCCRTRRCGSRPRPSRPAAAPRPACASRATASTEPPGGNGTMIRIGPDGQLGACPKPAPARQPAQGRRRAARNVWSIPTSRPLPASVVFAAAVWSAQSDGHWLAKILAMRRARPRVPA